MIQFVTENLIPFAFWELTFSSFNSFCITWVGATEHSCSVEGFYYWPVTQGKNETRDLGKEYEMPKVLFFI